MAKTRLRELRKKENWSMKYIAHHIGVSIQTVSNWEKGNTEPDIQSLIKLSCLYNVTIDYLVYRDYFKPDITPYIDHIVNTPSDQLKNLTIAFINKINNARVS